MCSSANRKIASHYLLTQQGFYKNPLITIDSIGRIVDIAHYGSDIDFTPGVEFYSGILCPAFINAHCHSELSYLLGAIPQGGGYSAFAASMAALRGNYTPSERAVALEQADRQMWEQGISAVADIVNDQSSFVVKADSKISYHSFAEVFGLKQSNLALCQQLTLNPNTSLTPHSTYSIQQGDMDAVCQNGDSLLTIHFKESEGEQQLFEGYGALATWYSQVGFECDFLHYSSPAERIIRSIPANRRVMLVHNCHITQHDIDLIMGHFTAPVYWTLCPRSNRYISGSLPQTVELLRANRLNICIGTDSLASNSSLSIIEELKCFDSVPLDERLCWAIYNGADALGIEPRGLINIVGADLQTMQLTDKSTVKRIF